MRWRGSDSPRRRRKIYAATVLGEDKRRSEVLHVWGIEERLSREGMVVMEAISVVVREDKVDNALL